ncbi:hypothetical protein CFC21_015297 [Triticum aestivum]|uniref:Uncharacterized protein n=2 Tax=Triticum aestivum TaxID=4565 RepID=A0A3B6AST2_WHEAT|nr:hypothetical protein CFC21_015297 [Triticum aestivum]
MAKRLRSPDRGDGGKRPRHGRKHLYVVLDDRQNGYSVHKVDADADGVGLADPPLLQLESMEDSGGVLVGALGSKILALWQPTADGQLTTHAVAYGTDTDKLAVGPPHPDALLTMRFVVAAGERLYALHEGGLHCLELVSESDSDSDETLPSGADEAEEHRWAWTRVSSPLRLPGCGGDPEEDDEPIEITSYALHPDGRTIFGQGHYDAGLDAWVGLHSPGYMCACDVPAPVTNGHHSGDAPRQPAWELVSAASLLYADPDPKVSDSAAWLVCMGGGQFCVVESMALAEAEQEDEHLLLRLATLRLERDLHGGLRASSRRTLACRVLKFDPLFSPRAFCM